MQIRTKEEQRGAEFEYWWETYGKPYADKVIALGGDPWTSDIEERRQLYFRRWSRPAPPDLPTVKSIKQIQAGSHLNAEPRSGYGRGGGTRPREAAA